MILYSGIFGKMDLYIRFIFFYVVIQMGSILLFIINISSSVYFEANKSYKLFNSFMTYRNAKLNKSLLWRRLKAWFINKFVANVIVIYYIKSHY
jgi:hypothetical protein